MIKPSFTKLFGTHTFTKGGGGGGEGGGLRWTPAI